MKCALRTLAAFALVAAAARAEAGSILVYTLSGTGTGTLDGRSFANAAFSITSLVDTSQILNDFFDTTAVDVDSSLNKIDVRGLASDTLSVDLGYQDSRGSSTLIFGQFIGGRFAFISFLGVTGPAFAAYNLDTTLATTPSNYRDFSGFPSGATPTQRGSFFLSSASGLTLTVTPVPEPSTLALAGIPALVGLGLAWRRSRAA